LFVRNFLWSENYETAVVLDKSRSDDVESKSVCAEGGCEIVDDEKVPLLEKKGVAIDFSYEGMEVESRSTHHDVGFTVPLKT